MTSIAVIDALEGDMGSTIIRAIRQIVARDATICTMGSNANATAQMMRAGVHHGVTGESGICTGVCVAGLIVGPISILICHSMMGEITPRMVDTIGRTRARKILIPVTDEPVHWSRNI